MANWKEPRKCEQCDAVFLPARWTQAYCDACRSTCSVAGCDKPMKTAGLCAGHRWRLLKNGKVGPTELRAPRGDPKARKPHGHALTLTCEVCAKAFKCPPSLALDAAGKVVRRFCSNECARSIKDARPTFECAQCGKTATRSKSVATQGYNYKQRFCSRACRDLSLYRGGYVHRGYRIIHVDGKAVPEHRDVVERAIGRKLLPTETIHHISGDKLDNRYPENLEIWSGRHGKGQRAVDHVAAGLAAMKLYPDLLAKQGYRLLPLESSAATQELGKPSFRDFDASEVIRGFLSMAT